MSDDVALSERAAEFALLESAVGRLVEGRGGVVVLPIIATGAGPYDVVHHTNTGNRVLRIHIGGSSAPGQFSESWADVLFVKGSDAGQPIV